jgi:heptosyltransferase-1
MPAPRVLFVKLSSLGDVIHHLPAVTDLARHRPGARIAWAVEEAYAPLVRLHPSVEQVIPVGLRNLRARPLERSRWASLAEARRALARGGWDYVIDSQGSSRARSWRAPRAACASAWTAGARASAWRHASTT